MSEHLRALVVVLLMAVPAWVLTRATLAPVVGSSAFSRRWAAWLVCTLVLFLANNAWLYVGGTAVAAWAFRRQESNPLALYFMLLMVAPPLLVEVPGFGVVNYLAALSHDRILALVILLPAASAMARSGRYPRLGSTGIDKLLIAYVVYTTLMQMRDTTFTDTLRNFFYAITDIVLLYYVSSRLLRERGVARDTLATLAMAAVPVALIAVVEVVKSWSLYVPVPGALGAYSSTFTYIFRDNLLRATASSGNSLVLGYYFVMALGALLFVGHFQHSRPRRMLVAGVIVIGLGASLARAPWLGAMLLFLLHGLFAPQWLATTAQRAAALAAGFLVLLPTALGSRLIDMLPYIGSVDAGNVDYRERLLDAGLIVAARSPWTGSFTFMQQPEMLELVQGQGIVDVVNSYLGLVLFYGVIGLLLFAALFIAGLRRGMVAARNPLLDGETRALAGAVTATTLVALVMIYTMSSILVVPILYWFLLGALAALPGRGEVLVRHPQPASGEATGAGRMLAA